MALIKCKECGQMMSDRATSCPNCGSPNKHNTSDRREVGTSNNFWLIALVVSAVTIIGFIMMGVRAIHDNHPMAATITDTNFKSIEDVKVNIEGTTWTYTEFIDDKDNYDRWCKLTFQDGKLYFYEVSPSAGDWGSPTVCEYTIEEKRYSNTGRKYIGIYWHGFILNYLFIPEEGVIAYQGRNGFVFGAKLKMHDSNPWN